MLNDGDIVQITDFQRASSVDTINTFFYVVEVIVAGIELLDLMLKFRDSVQDAIRDIQTASLEHLTLGIENLTNGIDIDQIAIGEFGTDLTGGPIQPTYVAAGYKLNVADRTTRAGGKRFGGIGEDRMVGNNYNPITAADAALETALSAALVVTGAILGNGVMTPIVVGRDILGALDLDRTAVIISANSFASIRSQVSRRAAAS